LDSGYREILVILFKYHLLYVIEIRWSNDEEKAVQKRLLTSFSENVFELLFLNQMIMNGVVPLVR
jgi:hypothetical protein